MLELHQEQREVGEEMGRYRHVAAYDYVLKDRILARLGGVLMGVPGAATWRHTPLTEDEWFTRTIVEEKRVREIQEKAKRLQEEREDPGAEIVEQVRGIG